MTTNPKEMPFLQHLEELRKRIIHIFYYYIIFFVACAYFSESIFYFLRLPMEAHFTSESFFIATKALSGWLVYMKIALISAGILLVPFFLFEILRFVSPGLKDDEKKTAIPIIIFMSSAFYSGIIFAFYFVLPLALKFFASVYIDTNIHFLPNIEDYLSFVLMTLFGFGILFLLPFFVFLLIKLGILPRRVLAEARPYIYVAAFVIGAIFTPPDVASQLMMAIPFVLLFELGMLMTWFIKRQTKS